MTWWCYARQTPWDWTWQPYPGVWAFVLAIAAAYIAGLRVTSGRPGGAATRTQRALFALGVLVLWASLDWPAGVLAAGYLASMHAVTYISLTLIVSPLLLLGTPGPLADAVIRLARARSAMSYLTHPVVALVIFNGVMVLTHLPLVVDGIRGTQLGGFTFDLLWLGSGLLMWWPVLGPGQMGQRLPPFAAMAYLFLQSVVPTVPASFLTFAQYPIYGLYELAPRIGGFSATTDQQVAGLTMKIGGGLILWTAITVIFFRSYAEEEREEARPLSWRDVESELEQLGMLPSPHRRDADSR